MLTLLNIRQGFVLMVLTIATPVVVAAPPQTLADLAEGKDWDRVSAMLEKGEDAGSKQPDGTTALHWAAFYDQAEMVKRLAKHGADLDALNRYQVSPLSLACEYGNAKAAMALIELDADVESKRIGKETPLMLAARNGDPQIVKRLLQHGASVKSQEVGGQTALMWAAAAGNAEAAALLIDAGADIHRTLRASGFSAPMFAARQGQTDVMMKFIESGFDVHTVIQPKRSGARDPRKGTSALLLAVESGHLDLALRLVEAGADPNDQRSGFAPLHAITWVRRTERGDNPAGDPAPRITGDLSTLDFVKAIVAAGADINLRIHNGKPRGGRLNPKGATPFLLASRGADIPLMRLMLELGADPTIPNADGTTPLLAAAGVGVIAVGEEPGTEEEVNLALRMLCDLGLDPNAVDRKGETAMHGAALRTFPKTVAVLAELGADPKIWNRENRRGWTPHEIAAGQRPGSVKPSPVTIAALDEAL
ncbi:ankyrin repeat domain-containing protein [Roseimaritima multifibrata]|nr:ankyrin repeat domain-containing protein [Roseimaritima multifibrata]